MGASSAAGIIRSTRIVAALALLACGCAGWGLASPAHAAVASFASTGAEQTFVVPAGITSVHVVAVGGAGGAGNPNLSPASGGAGGVAAADLAVAPGETLYVEVGGNGGDASNAGSGAAGFNGGGSPAPLTGGVGGGGGASDVRTVARAVGASASLSSRLVVAGGGGGAGAGGTSTPGGAGGGASGSPGAPAFCGGHGGTASAGGAAGTGMGGASAGQLGTGGAGGNATFASGPGGGGLYGGGGGGDDCGGGGGSGGFGPGTSNGSFGVDSSGSPSVTISYVVAPSVSLVSPVDGATYAQFGIVYAGYTCVAGTGTTISACTAPTANATPVDTSTPGAHTFTVTSTDADGGSAAATATYTVTAASSHTSPAPTAPVVPSLSKLRAAASWSLRRGTVFGFSLNEPARVTFAFKRHARGRKVHGKCVRQTARNRRQRKCTLTTPSGKLVVQASTGANLKRFGGKLTSGGRLRPGVYGMTVSATDANGHTASVPPVTVTIRPR